MRTITQVKMVLAACSLAVVAGCAQVDESVPAAREQRFAVSGIAVMPVRVVAEVEGAVSPAEEKALTDGSQVMNGLLRQVLAGTSGVRFVDEAMGSSREGAPGTLEAARRLAGQYSCNTVLETTLSRYNERVGGDYGVKQPAAVTFAYRLYEVSEGRMLCRGRFDEQQQSLMENLLVLGKAKSRGLTWLTAEELALDGLQDRLGQCSYLGDKQP